MPIIICRACKSHAKKAIDYIMDPAKADKIYMHGLDPNKDLAQQFNDTARMFGKGNDYGERKYYHIKISFEPKDNIKNGGVLDPSMAEKITKLYLQDNYGDNEYLLVVHTDKEHIHTHAIINSVRFTDGKKIQHSNRDLARMKDEINDISEIYGVSRFDWKQAVKDKRLAHKKEHIKAKKMLTQSEKYIQERHGEEWSSYSWKDTLRNKIDEAKEMCANREEIEVYLRENYGIEMPRNTEKTVSFKHPSVNETVRGTKLGADYASQALELIFKKNQERGVSYAKLRIAEQATSPNSPRTVTDVKSNEQDRVGEQLAEREFNGVHSTIRKIEEGTKTFSGTGREEIRKRERTEQAELARMAEEQRKTAERFDRECEELERQQREVRKRHRNRDYEHEM